MDIKVIDPNGKWYRNSGQFRFADPESGAIFEPGIATQASATLWLKGQPVIEEIQCPLVEVEEVKPKQVRAKSE